MSLTITLPSELEQLLHITAMEQRRQAAYANTAPTSHTLREGV